MAKNANQSFLCPIAAGKLLLLLANFAPPGKVPDSALKFSPTLRGYFAFCGNKE